MMEIPNGEHLFRYVSPDAFPVGQNEIPHGLFQDPELSCDWERYRSNPYSSFHIKQGNSVVIQITVCEAIKNPTNPKNSNKIEEAWKQEIIHDPIKEEDDPVNGANEAHSLIRGKKKLPVQIAIRDNSIFHNK